MVDLFEETARRLKTLGSFTTIGNALRLEANVAVFDTLNLW